MRINTNLMSLNTSNKLKGSNNKNSKSMEKLSSGLKIVRASDDAAGLSISEKMTAQIRGLNQGSRNTQDGISMIQTAEGAMNESSAILQRIRELSVQSSNGTYTSEDRSNMQDEVTELIKELDNISMNTEFNTIKVLNGTHDIAGIEIASGNLSDYVSNITTSGGVTETYRYGSTDFASAVIDFSNINSTDDVSKLADKGVNYTCCTCSMAYSIKFVSRTPDASKLNHSNPVMEVDIRSITNDSDLVGKILETAYGQIGPVHNPDNTLGSVTSVFPNATSFVKHYSKIASDGAKLYIYDERPNNHNGSWPTGGRGRFDLSVFGEVDKREERFLFRQIQVGANEGQSVEIRIPNISAVDLSIKNLDIRTQNKSQEAISVVDNAINRVSKGRSTLGAFQNRFEHIIKLNDNSSENLQNAESRIKDLDMAKEMVSFSKENILIQAAQTILSQANQFPSKVLELLR